MQMGNVHCVKSVLVRSYSVRMRENADQNNSEYGHFSRSIAFHLYLLFPVTPYLVLAVQPFAEWTPIKKKDSWSYKFLGFGWCLFKFRWGSDYFQILYGYFSECRASLIRWKTWSWKSSCVSRNIFSLHIEGKLQITPKLHPLLPIYLWD